MPTLLREMLERATDKMFDPTDREYVLYLKDHKTALLEQCTTKYLTPDQMAKYEHRPRYFLYENQYPQSADWILCWLNDLSGPEEFKNLKSVKVPNFSQLEDLYSTYRTLRTRMSIMDEQRNTT